MTSRRDAEMALVAAMMWAKGLREQVDVAAVFVLDETRQYAYQVKRGVVPDFLAHYRNNGEQIAESLLRVLSESALHGKRRKAARRLADGVVLSKEDREIITEIIQEQETADV